MNAPPCEIVDKLAVMRRWLAASGAVALRLRSVDWFAWATGGASNAVLLAQETGVAELLITAADAYVLTDEIEAQRLQEEEVGAGWTWQIVPWAQPGAREHFVARVAGGGMLLSDRPAPHEQSLPDEARAERFVLHATEHQRYREVGRLAAAAMSEALHIARPHWSEYELAGAGARALWTRGLHPALVLAAGESRLSRYRHPLPSAAPLGRCAMLVFCARQFGLYANLTRFVSFEPQSGPHDDAIMALEAAALNECRDGRPLSAIYQALAGAYAQMGQPDAIHEHHQGGITGYLARELLATADTRLPIRNGMALAFNPSLRGSKIEDTFLLVDNKLENLTFDPSWPSRLVDGRLRPTSLEAW